MRPQLTLHFGHRPAMGVEDFLVAAPNEAAVAWIDRWPDWPPGPGLVLHGPAGCGKTHLVQVWRTRSGGAVLPAAVLGTADPVVMLAGRPHCAIEGAETGVNELALFHLVNIIAEQGGSVLLTGREPPPRWRISLPDLRSRLNAMPSVTMHAPDDGLLEAVLVKLFDDRQLHVPQDVIDYLLPRLERSFEAAERAVTAIDDASLAERNRITVPLVREVLREA